VGETVHLRVINAGDQVHAMHPHGTPFEVVAQDGNRLAVPAKMDTLTISPGQTFDLLAKEPNEGRWLLHCHIFAHSHMSMDEHEDGDSGMTGMVTVLDVAPASSPLPPSPLAVVPIASPGEATARVPGELLAGAEPWLLVLGLIAISLIGLKLPNRKDHTQ
jgi:hypothetical protein